MARWRPRAARERAPHGAPRAAGHTTGRQPGWESGGRGVVLDLGRTGRDRSAGAITPERRVLGVFEIKPDLGDPAGWSRNWTATGAWRPKSRASVAGTRIASAAGPWSPTPTPTGGGSALTRRCCVGRFRLIGGASGDGWRTRCRRSHGLFFLAYPHPQTGTRRLTTVKRVRVRPFTLRPAGDARAHPVARCGLAPPTRAVRSRSSPCGRLCAWIPAPGADSSPRTVLRRSGGCHECAGRCARPGGATPARHGPTSSPGRRRRRAPGR